MFRFSTPFDKLLYASHRFNRLEKGDALATKAYL